MVRIDGFIDINKVLQEIGVDTTDLNSVLKDPNVDSIASLRYHFSFNYKSDKYFVKINDSKELNVYNELLVKELARDYGIPCVDYDLAILNSYKGVLSKNFKLKNANYIYGHDILTKYGNDTGVFWYNSLECIWYALCYRYRDNFNKEKIVNYLMKKIVDIYLFDIITCQSDRHSSNWQIMECDDNMDICPLYDNECILNHNFDDMMVSLSVICDKLSLGDSQPLYESIQQFQRVSSQGYSSIIKEKIWIIGNDNLKSAFERIENKIGCIMPSKYKEVYLSAYAKHKDRLEKLLGLDLEREKMHSKK